MLTSGNGARRFGATFGVLGGLVVVLTAAGQDRPETGGAPGPGGAVVAPAAPAPADPSEPPEPHVAIGAFNLVQSWVRAAEVPEPPDAGVIPRVAGASVVLRLDGEVVGRGTDLSEDGLALWRAARAAWAEASGRLQVERDALMETSLKQAAAGLTVSLELAGAPVPMLEAGYPELAAEIDPGVTGLVARAGDRVSTLFPMTMLSTGTMPDEAFSVVLLDLFGGDRARVMDERMALLAPGTLREKEGVAFLKVRVVHLAQWSPGGPPAFLHRGGRVVGIGTINVQGLGAMADGMARHLVGRAWPGTEAYGMLGRLNPATGKFDPRFADAAEQATAALALRRYAQAGGVDPTAAGEAGRFGLDLLAALAKVEPDERAPWLDPAPAAACVVAYLEGGRPGSEDDLKMAGLFTQCAAEVNESFDGAKGFGEGVAPGARGLVAWALVRLAADSSDEAAREKASAAVRAVYTATPSELLVGQMPWLGWAELERAGSGEVSAAVALRDMRDQVWQHQVGAGDTGPDDADFEGGVAFTKSRTPLPAWNTARALAVLATMLADARLTPREEQPGELVHLVEGLRFVRQLTVDEPATFMFKGPSRKTLGGVKAAPWDIRMPPDATSLSLLAVCEALKSLEAMQSSKAVEQQSNR